MRNCDVTLRDFLLKGIVKRGLVNIKRVEVYSLASP